jgi:hypothetical protein
MDTLEALCYVQCAMISSLAANRVAAPERQNESVFQTRTTMPYSTYVFVCVCIALVSQCKNYIEMT